MQTHFEPTAPFGAMRSVRRWQGGRLQTLRLPFRLTPTSLALAGIVLLAAALRFGNLQEIGQANTYYTAAVKSMLESWHNFFFVAAEPGGSVSVDKPPVGLWLQAMSAIVFGVNGVAVVLPQILAGIGSVILLFHLIRRSFGNLAGLVAAFALAVTPVAIAVERNNTPDGTLIFTLLLAAWAFIKATETRKLRFLLLGALLVGIGFNIKMMQAFLPLPAFYALYFFGSHQSWWRKIGHLSLATLVVLPVALSWSLIVDLTPADQRPYVGSSSTNSELDLAFGYNGVQRLLGNMRGGPARTATQRTTTTDRTTATADNTTQNTQNPFGVTPGSSQPPTSANGTAPGGFGAPNGNGASGAFGGPNGGPGGGGMFGTGQAGPLRLFQSGLAAQVSWLLPFGLLMLVAMALSMPWWRPETDLHRGLILWGGWLLTCVVFFSVAGFFHQYYLAMLGAPLAALVAMGVTFLWKLRSSHPIHSALLLLGTAAVTLGFQAYAVRLYMTNTRWLALPAVLAIAGIALLLLSQRREWRLVPRGGFALVTVALLLVPTLWSGLTTAYANTGGSMPSAYGATQGMGGGPRNGDQRNSATPMGGGMPGGSGDGMNQQLLNYLEAHTQGVKYLAVVPSSQAGAQYVLATGRPVLYAGGFSGSDPVIDGTKLAALVAKGDVRYVLRGGGGPGGGNGNTGTSISSYLQSSCSVVTDASLGTSMSSSPAQSGGFRGGPGGASTLYKCGS